MGIDLGGRFRGLFSALLTQVMPISRVREPSEGSPGDTLGVKQYNPHCCLAPLTPILTRGVRWRCRFPSTAAVWSPELTVPRGLQAPPGRPLLPHTLSSAWGTSSLGVCCPASLARANQAHGTLRRVPLLCNAFSSVSQLRAVPSKALEGRVSPCSALRPVPGLAPA